MSATRGIDHLLVETHHWDKSLAFWQGLGYALDFETDHHSGQLRNPAGGPTIFLAEVSEEHAPAIIPSITIDDAEAFAAPKAGTVERAFAAQHWGVTEMLLRDPDGRRLSVQAPLPSEVPATR
jgi:catechol 2,3-dioxygenase-like lactoylglutathione lyase family enzyme